MACEPPPDDRQHHVALGTAVPPLRQTHTGQKRKRALGGLPCAVDLGLHYCMVAHKLLNGAVPALLAVSALCATVAAWAADQPPPEIPTCDKRIGTLAVTEPENKWWLAYNLESPEALIKVFVSQSKCFTLLDRGKGLAAAQQERALSGSGEMRGGSNIGKGQMKAADYVLVPDVVTKNNNSGGRNIGGLVGGLLGGVAGAVVGGISLKSKTADVVLTLTDVRSTEQVALQQGHSK